MSGFAYTQRLNRLIDFTHPTLKSYAALMIPAPSLQEKNNIVSTWRPFQPDVISTYTLKSKR